MTWMKRTEAVEAARVALAAVAEAVQAASAAVIAVEVEVEAADLVAASRVPVDDDDECGDPAYGAACDAALAACDVSRAVLRAAVAAVEAVNQIHNNLEHCGEPIAEARHATRRALSHAAHVQPRPPPP